VLHNITKWNLITIGTNIYW